MKKIKNSLKKAGKNRRAMAALIVLSGAIFCYAAFIAITSTKESVSALQILSLELSEENEELKQELAAHLNELEQLKAEDQYKVNVALRARIAGIERVYTKAVSAYEELIRLQEISDESTDELQDKYTEALVELASQNYEESEEILNTLIDDIGKERAAIAASFTIPSSAVSTNELPGSGYRQQTVSIDIGNYLVSVVAADISTTKVIVDTASDSTCGNDCPVLSLASYVSRSGAYAGVNGTYFCPASYPSCAGKTNSFDTLVMNKNKTYLNSDNNVYSTNPAFIFGNGYVRFVGQVQDWGRDTSVDAVISNYPTLVQGGNLAFGGDDDPKKGSVGARSFVANRGNSIYIGVVHNATVAESARVLHAMGMENAMNLDSGGSTALYSGGYRVGPGRDLPNVLLFVAK